MNKSSDRKKKLGNQYAELLPISEKLHYWATDTIEAIRKNFTTQGIFPVSEPYSGYKEKNAKEARIGRRHSTGAGYDSFYFHILSASQNQDMVPQDVAVKILYNYYLRFVDMGVMNGLPADRVKKSASAHFDQRYFEIWDPKSGDTMRPAISMEIDHQSRRLGWYLAKQYEAEAQMIVMNNVGSLEIEIK